MKKSLKDYLVPHHGNDHKPHILREASVVTLAALVVGVFGLAAFQTHLLRNHGDFLAAVLPGTLIDLTNDDRADHDLPPLEYNALLESAAQLKANHMAEHGYFSHNSPDGTTPWEWFYDVGYTFTHAGENLAVNFSESDDVEDAWMDSPGHRDNILNGDFTQIGIATAEGEYEGDETIFVVQLFGTPSESMTEETEVVTNEESTSGDVDSETSTDNDEDEESTDVIVVADNEPIEEPTTNSNDTEPTQESETDEQLSAQDPDDNPFFDPQYAQQPESETVESPEQTNESSGQTVALEDDTSSEQPVSENQTEDNDSDSEPEDVVIAPVDSVNDNAPIQTAIGEVQEQGVISLATTNRMEPFPRWLSRLVSNPTLVLEIMYVLIAGLVITSLALMIRKDAYTHHPREVFYGVALVTLILVFTFMSHEMLFQQGLVAQEAFFLR